MLKIHPRKNFENLVITGHKGCESETDKYEYRIGYLTQRIELKDKDSDLGKNVGFEISSKQEDDKKIFIRFHKPN